MYADAQKRLGCQNVISRGLWDADEAILKEARLHNAQPIVIGTHRSRVPAVASRLTGGTAYNVAATADCPVLTIPNVNSLAPDVTSITESQQCRE